MGEFLLTGLDVFHLLISLVIHELGHYLMSVSYNFDTRIRINWLGVVLVESDGLDSLLITGRQLIIINLSGILFGQLYLMIAGVSGFALAIYWLGCGLDIITIMNVFSLGKEHLDLPIILSQDKAFKEQIMETKQYIDEKKELKKAYDNTELYDFLEESVKSDRL